jgi:hypothetical protein
VSGGGDRRISLRAGANSYRPTLWHALISEIWKNEIVAAHSEDTIKADVLNDITPLPRAC